MVPTTLYVIYMLFSGYEEQPNIYIGGVNEDYKSTHAYVLRETPALSAESSVMIPDSPLMAPEPPLLFPESSELKNLADESFEHKNFSKRSAEDVKLGEYPSLVLLKNLTDDPSICSGFIVNINWAITAAHCVYGVDPRDIVLVSGTIDLDNGGTVHEVVEVKIYEEFALTSLHNDIALVKTKVSTHFVFGPYVQPATLPSRYFLFAGSGTVVGWGTQQRGGPKSTTLKKEDVVLANQLYCNRKTLIRNRYEIFPNHICAFGSPDGDYSGDIGSPLFVGNEVVGIVSWIEQCGDRSIPEIYTRVRYFIDWILSNTAIHNS